MAFAYVEGWGRLNRHRSTAQLGGIPGARSMRAALLCAIALLGIAGIAHAQHAHKEHKRDYKREIELVEQQWRTAQLAGDVATMDKLLAEDYLGISNNGQINNKTQQLERLQKRM